MPCGQPEMAILRFRFHIIDSMKLNSAYRENFKNHFKENIFTNSHLKITNILENGIDSMSPHIPHYEYHVAFIPSDKDKIFFFKRAIS